MPHKKPSKRQEEEVMRRRKRIRGNLEPVRERVKGRSGGKRSSSNRRRA